MLHFKVVITWQQLEVLLFLVLCSEIVKASLLELFKEMKTLQKTHQCCGSRWRKTEFLRLCCKEFCASEVGVQQIQHRAGKLKTAFSCQKSQAAPSPAAGAECPSAVPFHCAQLDPTPSRGFGRFFIKAHTKANPFCFQLGVLVPWKSESVFSHSLGTLIFLPTFSPQTSSHALRGYHCTCLRKKKR